MVSLGQDSCGCGMLGSRAVRTPGRLDCLGPLHQLGWLPVAGAPKAVCFGPLGCGCFSASLDLSHGQTWVVGSSLLVPRSLWPCREILSLWALAVPSHHHHLVFSFLAATPALLTCFLPALPLQIRLHGLVPRDTSRYKQMWLRRHGKVQRDPSCGERGQEVLPG